MTAIVLDTLEYATKLKTGGFSEQQAETQARALAEVLEKQIATKAEVAEHENNLRRDIAEIKRDLRETELRLEARLADTKADLTRWVVGVGLLQTTLIIGVLMKVAKLI